MSTSHSLCLTCLSSLEEGASLTETLKNFLCDVLQFNSMFVEGNTKFVCRKCYKTLIELKCFYAQLRDVEVYFQSKFKLNTNDPNDLIEEVGFEPEPFAEMECTFSPAEESKCDPILINEEARFDFPVSFTETDESSQQQKPNNINRGRRFFCLKCSKLFKSVSELRTHEKVHARPSALQKPSGVFFLANVPVPENLTCLECGKEFSKAITLESHMREHNNELLRPFYCTYCKRRFPTKELLINHDSKHPAYECKVCQKKCCNRTALEIHMRVTHKRIISNSNGVVMVNATPYTAPMEELNNIIQVEVQKQEA